MTDGERNRTIQSASLIEIVRTPLLEKQLALKLSAVCCLPKIVFLGCTTREVLNVTTPGNVYLITAAHFLDTVFLVLNALCDCVR